VLFRLKSFYEDLEKKTETKSFIGNKKNSLAAEKDQQADKDGDQNDDKKFITAPKKFFSLLPVKVFNFFQGSLILVCQYGQSQSDRFGHVQWQDSKCEQ